MIKRILYTLTVFMTLAAITGILSPATAAAYDPFGQACNSSGSQSAVCSDRGTGSTNPLTGPNGLFRGISGVLAFITGMSALIIIIVSGFRYVTAGGDANKAKSARQAIVAALIGLVIILLADSIISFVLSRI